MTILTNAQLRHTLRQQRLHYPIQLQQHAAEDTCHHLLTDQAFIRSQHIAVYWPHQGELDPFPLIKHAWRIGKKIYLPVLAPLELNRLYFARFNPHTKLGLNRFGIPEPQNSTYCCPMRMNLILCPLVGFNSQGDRLGMGGGFYDRTLAKTLGTKFYGLAYSWQQLNGFKTNSWDIGLHAVATEKGLIKFKP